MKRHFVKFYSPGTFVAETTTKPIGEWDVSKAMEIAGDIKERYGARPYGFQFLTRERGDDDLDSSVTEKSPMYYLGGKVRTLAEVQADNLPDEKILLSNMDANGWDRIITTTEGWKWVQPLEKEDVVLND